MAIPSFVVARPFCQYISRYLVVETRCCFMYLNFVYSPISSSFGRYIYLRDEGKCVCISIQVFLCISIDNISLCLLLLYGKIGLGICGPFAML